MSLLDETTDQLRTKDMNCICACTRLTDLVAFVKGSYEPLLNSNYNALTALKYSTLSNIKRNRGAWLSVGLVVTILGILICSKLTSVNLSSSQKAVLFSLNLSEERSSAYKYRYHH